MSRPLIIVTINIRILVAVVIRKEATLVVQSMIQDARAKCHFGGEVFEISIMHNPSVADFMSPSRSKLLFPLRGEVPTEWNRPAPQTPKIKLKSFKCDLKSLDY